MSALDDYWVLDGHQPIRATWETYLAAWSKKPFAATRAVAKTEVGEASVSTVFLTIDHNWGDGPPILFETMVFGGPLNDYMWRYQTWDAAVEGHNEVVAALTEGREPNVDDA